MTSQRRGNKTHTQKKKRFPAPLWFVVPVPSCSPTFPQTRKENLANSKVCFPPKHSFTISANEVDMTDSIRSLRGRLPAAAVGGRGHVTGGSCDRGAVFRRQRPETRLQEATGWFFYPFTLCKIKWGVYWKKESGAPNWSISNQSISTVINSQYSHTNKLKYINGPKFQK